MSGTGRQPPSRCEFCDGGEFGYHDIHIPWDALALDHPSPKFGDETERRQVEFLQNREHLDAINRLLDALSPCIDLIDSEATSTFTPVLESGSNLHMLLSRLAEIATLYKPRIDREFILVRLQHDLPIIDFPNLLATRVEASGDDRPSFVIVENSRAQHPKDRAEWSESVHAAHSHALDKYLDWEAIFQRYFGAK
ncbi:hypothetical protein [Ferribacterium limneticum]|uniref:hypothetical protein n=1 Tax=Ferribacterium limneticum TaxID=76259 RepID=UPI001CF7F9F1|nr:hypothetical protein [Ferribacterium limneticum]UCV22546.1 hypothetical protein KI613_18865 [Ferribacterium limneticum]